MDLQEYMTNFKQANGLHAGNSLFNHGIRFIPYDKLLLPSMQRKQSTVSVCFGIAENKEGRTLNTCLTIPSLSQKRFS